MPVITVKREIISDSHEFWVLSLPWEVGEWVQAYGQTLGEALRNLAQEVAVREKAQAKREEQAA